MRGEQYSLLVDAAYLQICARESYKAWYKENGKRKPPKLTQSDWFASFWITIATFIHYETLDGRDYSEDGKPSIYVFDALFDDDREKDWSTNVKYLTQEIRDRIEERSAWQEFIYSHSLKQLPIEQNGGFTATIAEAFDQPQKGFRDLPNTPGIYRGFLSSDQREPSGVSQKAVDTMLTLCGVLKANEGRSISVYSNDQDFLPLAVYVLNCGRTFNLVNWDTPGAKWRLLDSNPRFSRTEMRPTVNDHFG